MRVCYWPDGTWCVDDELHEMTHMSDDYGVIELPDENHYEDWHIDIWVREFNTGAYVSFNGVPVLAEDYPACIEDFLAFGTCVIRGGRHIPLKDIRLG